MSGKREKTTKTKTTKPIAEGIFQVIATGAYRVTWFDRRQREKRFPADTPIKTMKDFRRRMERVAEDTKRVEGGGGSFIRDIVRFLKSRKHRPCYKSDRSHLRPWAKRFGRSSRHAITKTDVTQSIAAWSDKSPREVRHRVNALRQVFNFLDPDMPNPCENLKKALPRITKTRPKGVPDDLITRVALNLFRQEQKGRLRSAQTRARFLVLATCGKRPCQVRWAKPDDVNFKTRIWDVVPAKNSHGGPLYLNDEMLAAWKMFAAANAWGAYDAPSFAKTIRRNGWPAGIRPYNLRHTTLQTMSDRGVDLGGMQQAAGHASPETTMTFYAEHGLAKSKKTGDAINGRFNPDVFTPREPKKYDPATT